MKVRITNLVWIAILNFVISIYALLSASTLVSVALSCLGLLVLLGCLAVGITHEPIPGTIVNVVGEYNGQLIIAWGEGKDSHYKHINREDFSFGWDVVKPGDRAWKNRDKGYDAIL